ncbi:hypothetical protein, partial [Methylobacterium sp. WL2]|uniref:hypothetical protein n=1 Tax=Methylobacterium sp. WL2 TaxID=2603902 RepID=UPI001AED4AA5
GMKPRLSDLPPEDREALAEATLQEEAARDPASVGRRLRLVFERLAAEGVFEGMSEAQVRATVQEAVQDLGVSPSRDVN